jgi:uncharacterized protein YndB with AHSA1/START domain
MARRLDALARTFAAFRVEIVRRVDPWIRRARHMERLRFSVEIDAPRGKVWDTMLGDATYRIWTAEFMPGSYYVGDWEQGSKILFLAPGERGETGIVSRIRVNRPYEHISIEHLGMVEDGREDTSSEAATAWAGALENYTFRDVDGKTEVQVEMDSDEDMKAMFEETWPKALQRLKELAEQPNAG